MDYAPTGSNPATRPDRERLMLDSLNLIYDLLA